VSTMVNNVPVVLTGIPYGKCRVEYLVVGSHPTL
jgi:hypothetical protein